MVSVGSESTATNFVDVLSLFEREILQFSMLPRVCNRLCFDLVSISFQKKGKGRKWDVVGVNAPFKTRGEDCIHVFQTF